MHVRIHIARDQIQTFPVNDFFRFHKRGLMICPHADNITVMNIHLCRKDLSGKDIDMHDVCDGFTAGDFSHGCPDQLQFLFLCFHIFIIHSFLNSIPANDPL